MRCVMENGDVRAPADATSSVYGRQITGGSVSSQSQRTPFLLVIMVLADILFSGEPITPGESETGDLQIVGSLT